MICFLLLNIILFSKGLVEFHTVGGEQGENVCKIIGLTQFSLWSASVIKADWVHTAYIF